MENERQGLSSERLSEDYLLDEVTGNLDSAIHFLEEGKKEESDRILQEMINKLEGDLKQEKGCLGNDEPVCIGKATLPTEGEVFAADKRICLKVIARDEREEYLATVYENSFWKEAFKDERFQQTTWDSFWEEGKLACSIYLEGKYAGYCYVKPAPKGGWEVAIELKSNAQGKGCGAEALSLLMKGFGELTGTNDFLARVDVDNKASQKMVRKLGGVPDGVSELWLHGEALRLIREDNRDKITDELRRLAEEFGVEPIELIGCVLNYRIRADG